MPVFRDNTPLAKNNPKHVFDFKCWHFLPQMEFLAPQTFRTQYHLNLKLKIPLSILTPESNIDNQK